MKSNLKKSLQDKLLKREEEGTLRSLSSFEGTIDFFSNDYLGFAKHKINHRYFEASTGSRLISGTSKYSLEVEAFLAQHFNAEAALVFNSGYDANLGLFSSILQRTDIVLYDEYIHASIRDGIRLGLSKSYAFKHNNVDDLEQKLMKLPDGVYVAIESLYSMDGDFSPLKEIIDVCQKYNAYLIVDEAHSGGIYGDLGKGVICESKFEKYVFARIITFGKAFGAHGAVVLGSKSLKEYLVNFSRSFIYTTALPLDSFERIKLNVDLVSKDEEGRNILQENINFFRDLIPTIYLKSDLNSPIQIIRISDLEKLRLLVKEFQKNQIAVKPIFSPTVPKGDEGIRICLHRFNSKGEIKSLTNILNYFLQN